MPIETPGSAEADWLERPVSTTQMALERLQSKTVAMPTGSTSAPLIVLSHLNYSSPHSHYSSTLQCHTV